jgi:hypothetical protein
MVIKLHADELDTKMGNSGDFRLGKMEGRGNFRLVKMEK